MTEQKTPVLEPKAQQFIDAVVAQGGKPLYTLSHADARKLKTRHSRLARQERFPSRYTGPLAPGDRCP